MESNEQPDKETPEGGYECAAELTRFIQVRGRFSQDGYVLTAIKPDGPATRVVADERCRHPNVKKGAATHLDVNDVIVEVDGLKIRSQVDYATAMNRAKDPKRIEINVRDCYTGKVFAWYVDSVDSPFVAFAGITDDMDLADAIVIMRRFPLETLLVNLQSTTEGTALWRSASAVLAECPDPKTMPRLFELLKQDLEVKGELTWSLCLRWLRWFGAIESRLKNEATPSKERKLAIAELLPLADRKVRENEANPPVPAMALDALCAAGPLPPEVVERCSKKLSHAHSGVASSALRILINLPPKERGQWVPLLLKQLQGRFSTQSEATWIIECLTPHFSSHRKEIVPVLRVCLKSDDAFVPTFALELLCRLGPAATEMVPDILEFIGRTNAYSNQEPYLFHVDPEGTAAIPGLIELLGNKSSCVSYQAATELEAFGARAQAAVPELTKLAKAKSKDKQYAATAAQRALLAIESGGSVPEKLSQAERLFGVLEDAITDSNDEK